jgi:hypothetical protein
MVNVPVDDRDPLESENVLGVTRGDGDVVDEAEAHRAIGQRMVARRAHERESAALHGSDRAPRGKERCLERGRAGDRVAVQPRLLLERGKPLEIGDVMDALDLGAGR